MAGKEKTSAEVKTSQKFPVGKLRENCIGLFGVSTSTFDGATYGMSGQYSVEKMKTHIEKWKKEGVK